MAEEVTANKPCLENNSSLLDFNLIKVLGLCPQKVFLHGTLSNKPGEAVAILERPPFSTDDFPGIFQESQTAKIYFENDIYLSLQHFPNLAFSGLKATLIYPATEQIIKKYTIEPNSVAEETAELYKAVTEAYIAEKPAPEWLYNILEHKSEADRIIYEDPHKETGFILLPDLKWDGIKPEGFYVQALPHLRGVRTIRDVTAAHLPLLRNIQTVSPKIIEEKYKIAKSDLLIYLHYLPSFYHLHVHFRHIGTEFTSGTGAERAHLLSTVITNLQICPNYYQQATLPISLKKTDPLLQRLLAPSSSD